MKPYESLADQFHRLAERRERQIITGFCRHHVPRDEICLECQRERDEELESEDDE
jgi:uncharacterized OB-fold protein